MEIMTNVNLCTEDKALEKLLPEYQYDKKLFTEYTKVFWTFPLLVNTFIKSKYLHKTPKRCSLEHSMRVLNLCPLNSSHRHIHLHWISICVLQSFSLLFISIWPYTYVKSVLLKEQSIYTNLIIGLNRTVMKHQQSSKNGWYFREKIKHKITSQSFGVVRFSSKIFPRKKQQWRTSL